MNDYRIDRTRWSKLSIYEQMANIGAEVGRSIQAQRTNKTARRDAAIDRALDLFDATIEQLVKEKSYRLREVIRARNEYLRLFFDDTFDADAASLERYFTQFAVAARNLAQIRSS